MLALLTLPWRAAVAGGLLLPPASRSDLQRSIEALTR